MINFNSWNSNSSISTAQFYLQNNSNGSNHVSGIVDTATNLLALWQCLVTWSAVSPKIPGCFNWPSPVLMKKTAFSLTIWPSIDDSRVLWAPSGLVGNRARAPSCQIKPNDAYYFVFFYRTLQLQWVGANATAAAPSTESLQRQTNFTPPSVEISATNLASNETVAVAITSKGYEEMRWKIIKSSDLAV